MPCCPRLVGDIYQPSYIHDNLAKTHQKQRRGSASGGGGRAARFRCRCLCPKAFGKQAVANPVCSLLEYRQ